MPLRLRPDVARSPGYDCVWTAIDIAALSMAPGSWHMYVAPSPVIPAMAAFGVGPLLPLAQRLCVLSKAQSHSSCLAPARCSSQVTVPSSFSFIFGSLVPCSLHPHSSSPMTRVCVAHASQPHPDRTRGSFGSPQHDAAVNADFQRCLPTIAPTKYMSRHGDMLMTCCASATRPPSSPGAGPREFARVRVKPTVDQERPTRRS